MEQLYPLPARIAALIGITLLIVFGYHIYTVFKPTPEQQYSRCVSSAYKLDSDIQNSTGYSSAFLASQPHPLQTNLNNCKTSSS